MNKSHPIREPIIRIKLFNSIDIIIRDTQVMIPIKKRITQVILSFLLYMKSDR